MKQTLSLFTLLALAGVSNAATVQLSPADINLGNTNTASFSNADVTITPLVGGVASTFNANASRLGIDDAGTSNANAFNDPDTTAGNAND